MSRRLTTVLCVLTVAALAFAGQAAATRSTSSASQTYVVKPGDTLSSIASRYGTTVQAIAFANAIRNPNVIIIGNRLAIPSGGSSSSRSHGVLPAKLLAHPDRVRLRPLFVWWGTRYGVAPDLLESLAWIESGWQANVVSKTWAIGIGQLEPAPIDFTRALIGLPLNPMVASDNIRMSARFLRLLLDRTGNNVPLSLAAYYEGLRNVQNRVVLPDTLLYVAAILAVRPSFA